MGNTGLVTTKATTLDTVYKTLKPYPLKTAEELAAFYQDDLNAIRGGDKIKRLTLRLRRERGDGLFFKACLMGHSGVGKSTELSRLAQNVASEFEVVRFSAVESLDPESFHPLDILILMMSDLVDAADRLQLQPSEKLLEKVLNWFATEATETNTVKNREAETSAGAGWKGVIPLFATLKTDIKYASTRSTKITEYRVSYLRELLMLCNNLLDDCANKLEQQYQKSWLFIGEDFDRAGITNERLQSLFVTYAHLFQGLRTHLIFNIPISLYYSPSARNLPFRSENSFVLPDTPVFHQNHTVNEQGRQAVKNVLKARMDLALFESDDVLERVIVSSGGNIRDLFTLVNYASDTALLKDLNRIHADDVDTAVVNLRTQYERRLGSNPFDPEPVDYEQKASRLCDIYNGIEVAQMTDPVMYSLLNARAVQEFNGQRWFGVHPLVVDLLKRQGLLEPSVPGGTR